MQLLQYSFSVQNKIGKIGEKIIDQWLTKFYQIKDVSTISRYQKAGIDRILTRPDGSEVTAEYKFDNTAKRTGNIFFETISVDREQMPGWGWSSKADYWIFLIPDQEILVVRPEQLRNLAWVKHNELQEKKIPNKGYNTLGVPISLLQVRKVAVAIKKL